MRNEDCLSERGDGRLEYELRQPWSDGTRAVVFEPRCRATSSHGSLRNPPTCLAF